MEDIISFPSDLVEEIILLLPVKPILRFRCVSKSLCSLVGSRNFRKEHLQRSIENKTNRKLIIHELNPPNIEIELAEFYAINLSEEPITWDEKFKNQHYRDDDKYANDYDKLNHPCEGKLGTRICGFCNGIILLKIYHTLFLWNPFTRRYKKLPFVETSHSNCPFGLGYDHVRDDYKVVMLSNEDRPNKYKSRIVVNQVWVFSLKLNSWSKLVPNIPLADCYITNFFPGLFANDALFWALGEGIMGFDLVNETFFYVPLPEYTPRQSIFNTPSLNLNVLDGYLLITFRTTCITSYSNGQSEFYMESHVLENEGGGFTWRKLDNFRNSLSVLAYSKKGDKIW